MSNNTAPLMSDNFVLYDAAAMLDLDKQMAQGYFILLQGTPEQARGNKKVSQQTVMLAFSALTDGNVVDACFGIRAKKDASAQANRLVKDVKRLLIEAADQNNNFARAAVTAYSTAFKSILSYRTSVEHCNFFLRCIRYGSLQRKCKQELKEAFVPLQEALAEANS